MWGVVSSQGPTDIGSLASRYNAANHPRVRTREKTAEQIADEFRMGISMRAPDGNVTEEAFLEYYADLNACLPTEKDEYFVDMALSVWNMSQDSYITPKRVEELEETVFEKVRQRTHGADDEGKTIRKTFRHFDLNENGVISLDEFKQVLDAYGCVFKDAEIFALFNKYDKDNSGMLDYEEFSSFFALKGSGNNPNVNPVFGLEREPPNQIV